jgi:hypothetical protein
MSDNTTLWTGRSLLVVSTFRQIENTPLLGPDIVAKSDAAHPRAENDNERLPRSLPLCLRSCPRLRPRTASCHHGCEGLLRSLDQARVSFRSDATYLALLALLLCDRMCVKKSSDGRTSSSARFSASPLDKLSLQSNLCFKPPRTNLKIDSTHTCILPTSLHSIDTPYG